MNKIIGVGVILWCLILAFVPEDLRRTQDCLAYILAFIIIGRVFYKKAHPVLGVAYAYYGISLAPFFIFPREFYRDFDIGTIAGFEALISQGFIALTVFSLVLFFTENLNNWAKVFRCLALINAVVICVKWSMGLYPCFLLSNPAWDAAFIGICLPLFLRHISRPSSVFWLVPFVMAAIVSDSSSGVLGFGVAAALYIWAKDSFSLRATVSLILVSLGTLAVGFALQKEILFNGTGRYHVWDLAMQYMFKEGNSVFGQGMGTFHIYGPSLQVQEAMRLGYKEGNIPGFTWLHNEWLQVLFETGLVGFGVGLAVFATAIYKARLSPAKFAALGTFGVLAIPQPLLRNHLTAFLGLFLIIWPLCTPKKSGGGISCQH